MCSVAADQLEASSDEVDRGDSAVVAGLRAMAAGFTEFSKIVEANTGRRMDSDSDPSKSGKSVEVFDCWLEKLASLRAAVYVSGVVAQTNLDIVGSSSDSRPSWSLQPHTRSVVGTL